MQLLFSVTKKDLIRQTFRSGGKGGQNQNKVESGVRFIHPPSGARGEARDSRDQGRNERSAFLRLIHTPEFQSWHKSETSRLLGRNLEVAERVRTDAGFGANKIRTYNFDRHQMTDHRTGKDYRLEDVMDGRLGPVIKDCLESGVKCS